MHTRLILHVVRAGELKPGDLFSLLAYSRKEVPASALLSLGVATKGAANLWTRSDTPCPDELAKQFLLRGIEVGMCPASDLKPGDLFRPVYATDTQKLHESPLVGLGTPVEGRTNVWVRASTPCPEDLAMEYVYRMTEEEIKTH